MNFGHQEAVGDQLAGWGASISPDGARHGDGCGGGKNDFLDGTQLPVLAQVLQEGVVDVDHAVVGSPDPCDKNATFVDSLKAQILLQIFGNFTLERVVSDVQGSPPPPSPARGSGPEPAARRRASVARCR